MKQNGFFVIIVLAAGVALGIGTAKLGLLPGGTGGDLAAVAATAEDAHDHAAGGHAHGDAKTSQITVWGARFEVFLEHPYLVAGEPAGFVTHVSDLTTGEPRTAGPVTFVLTNSSGALKEYVAPTPARAGIYIPQLTFPSPGEWAVTLKVPLDGAEHQVKLPAVRVYASQAEADTAPAQETPTGISFLKEQQWPVRMKVQPARSRTLGGKQALVIPHSALFEESGKQALFVQVAGETVQKRYPSLGQTDAGMVEVVSGVNEGEQVICEALAAVIEAERHDSGVEHAHDDAPSAGNDPARFGIETGPAGPGVLELRATLAGEVKLNANKVAHIVPQVPGRVREVRKDVGDPVQAGEVMAWLESTALGQAKIDYLSKFAEISCQAMELTRAREIHDNATHLLKVLESAPPLETLRDKDWGPMGSVRSELIGAYAELHYARAAHEREQQLFEKQITSGDDFHRAQSDLKKAEAVYQATRDTVAFEIRRGLIEATHAHQIRELDVVGAERNLYVLGLTAADMQILQKLAPSHSSHSHDSDADPTGSTATQAHDDGDHATENEHLAWYPLRAPFDGTVIDKRLSLGEAVKEDADAFVVADLGTVWVDFRVHQKDLPAIGLDQTILIECGLDRIEGKIAYLSPVVDNDTRTALARVIVPNPSGGLRPGTFVSGVVTLKDAEAPLVVEKSALQYIDDQPCVFAHDGHAFEKRHVMLGRTDGRYIEITAGLQPGETIVTKNAFRIKSEMEKAKTAVSGHGHVH
ncbi:efflux RND transporter periplasmic adaptor subunit [Anaerobaca lacustris]|uniref:Efflux RND transporter periplasmic adaptor subunit n=1 Tax=Anaerobaca lacustris TaxID=3044600 RepID=A0AAW6U8D8_9BACT|nr:efflux RND transporter periplasmic adaptor subunit [Sedimentisphaerales bacterium M17dextr]